MSSSLFSQSVFSCLFEMRSTRSCLYSSTQSLCADSGYTHVFFRPRLADGGVEDLIRVYELPAATMASVIHKGAFNQFMQAYEALGRWTEANGYTVVGPNHEIYLGISHAVPRAADC